MDVLSTIQNSHPLIVAGDDVQEWLGYSDFRAYLDDLEKLGPEIFKRAK